MAYLQSACVMCVGLRRAVSSRVDMLGGGGDVEEEAGGYSWAVKTIKYLFQTIKYK